MDVVTLLMEKFIKNEIRKSTMEAYDVTHGLELR